MEIDFYGDLTCPWSHLGWRRLGAALRLRGLSSSTCRLHWRPYQLNLDLPPTGMDRGDYLLHKFGQESRVRDVLATVDAAMASEGLQVNLPLIRTMPNTARAHRLVQRAQEQGSPDALLEELFVAYFVQGQDIGDPEVLGDLARRVGLPPDEGLNPGLDGDAPLPSPPPFTEIRAIPYIVFDGLYSIAGAHDPIAFLPLIDLCRITPALTPSPE